MSLECPNLSFDKYEHQAQIILLKASTCLVISQSKSQIICHNSALIDQNIAGHSAYISNGSFLHLIAMISVNKNLKLALLFGGQSPEHEVSIQSARNLHEALKFAGYDTLLIGIDAHGIWRLMESVNPPNSSCPAIVLLPGGEGRILNVSTGSTIDSVDMVFPAVHGPNCEDGSLQGTLKLANVPFVGSSICSSANCMDKSICKSLLSVAGIEIVDYITCTRESTPTLDTIKSTLGMPLIIKPANMGSSLGVEKIEDEHQFEPALQNAYRYDRKILIEEYVEAIEIECAVLYRNGIEASIPGAIRTSKRSEIYNYESKYVDSDGVEVDIPARVSPELTNRIKEISISAYQALGCEGMARVDLFLDDNGRLLVNEINTLPGFTSNSLYPKLWAASGVSETEIIQNLIVHSLIRFEAENELKRK